MPPSSNILLSLLTLPPRSGTSPAGFSLLPEYQCLLKSPFLPWTQAQESILGFQARWRCRKRLQAAEFIQKKAQITQCGAEGISEGPQSTTPQPPLAPYKCLSSKKSSSLPTSLFPSVAPDRVDGIPDPCHFHPRISASLSLERLQPPSLHFTDQKAEAQRESPWHGSDSHCGTDQKLEFSRG